MTVVSLFWPLDGKEANGSGLTTVVSIMMTTPTMKERP